MRRLCERPGCLGPAEVSYGIDNANLTVWIDNSHVPEREHAGRLCRRHADALGVPRGWTIDDRRQPIPRLFRDLTVEIERMPERPRRKTTRRRDATILDAPSTSEAPVDQPDEPTLFTSGSEPIDPDETRAIAWSPATVAKEQPESDDTDDDAPVMGRLLGRAFRKNA